MGGGRIDNVQDVVSCSGAYVFSPKEISFMRVSPLVSAVDPRSAREAKAASQCRIVPPFGRAGGDRSPRSVSPSRRKFDQIVGQDRLRSRGSLRERS
jgi:hypothetical protein